MVGARWKDYATSAHFGQVIAPTWAVTALFRYNRHMVLTEISDQVAWDLFVNAQPFGHPLQLWGWGESKRHSGWIPSRLVLMDGDKWVAGVQVLEWQIPKLKRKLAYVPRGPIVEPGSQLAGKLFEALVVWAKNRKLLYVRIEPAWIMGQPRKGWVQARHHVQLAETYTIDLRKSSEELLEPMSHKHRQYIRKSERDGVSVKRVENDDINAMLEIYVETAKRAGFGIHDADYYKLLNHELGDNSYLYYAQFDGKPVAFLWLAAAGKTAYELYGGVNQQGGEVKANYFLKWYAIEEMKKLKYEIYDFNGRLNEGVSRFKDGFGPDATDYIGTWDYPLNRTGYRLWESLWPVMKVVGRRVAQMRSS
jgi:peptidoglycan pentaglycine glycine transferase (the first glycine)